MATNIEIQNNDKELEGLNTPEEIDNLKEQVNPNIDLSELGQYDSEGNFQFKEDIKGKDENGEYIEVRGQKYYKDNDNGLGYSIGKDIISNFDQVHLGNFVNNQPEKYGIKFTKDFTFKGEWKDGIPVSGTLIRLEENGDIKSIYRGEIDGCYRFQGKGRIEFINGDYYEGYFRDGKYEGQGTYYYENNHTRYEGGWEGGQKKGKGKWLDNNGEVLYDGEYKHGKYEGHGIRKYADGTTYEGEWIDGNAQEGKGIMTYEDGKKYMGYFLIDKKGDPKPFYKIYEEWRGNHLSDGLDLEKSMEGTLYDEYGEHTYKLTRGSVTEEGNSFITMYGDKKPNKKRDDERGSIILNINYSPDSNIKQYKLKSWHREDWDPNCDYYQTELNGGYYQFKNRQGDILSIPKSDNFGEKAVLHTINLINKLIYECKKHNREYGFGHKEDILLQRVKTVHTNDLGRSWYVIENDSHPIQLEYTPQHFGGKSTEEIVSRLNGILGGNALKPSGKCS